MATVLTGKTEIKRIWELLEKVLSGGELSDYSVAIDKQGESDTKRVPIDNLLAFAALVARFSDASFSIYNNSDDTKELEFLLSGITTGTTRTLTIPDISGILAAAGMIEAFSFGGQAHGGSYTKTFSASATFDADDGNVQKMLVTASTTIAISNELPGTYIIKLEIDTASSPTVTIGASIGTKLPNGSLDIDNADNAINIITIVVDPDGTKDYSITN